MSRENTENSNPIFFITPNPNRAIGLEGIIKNYHVICSQKSDAVDYFKKNKTAVLCLNDDKIKNSGKILLNKKVIKYIKEKSKNKEANIITFKPSPMIQKICAENNFSYLGNDWRLNRDLEDKIKFIEITKKLKIPNAGSKIIRLKLSYFCLAAVSQQRTAANCAFSHRSPLLRDCDGARVAGKSYKLEKNKCSLNFSKNKKFIVQLPRGFSGNSTFLIKNKNDFAEIFKKYENRKIKLSEYIKGETYTINVCVAENKILISKPIFQITGFSLYNKNNFGTCGNDYAYPEKLKKEQKKKIFDYTKKIGNYLKKLKYKGIFGLDFIVNENGVNLIEINPRLIASIPVFTKLQIQNKQLPFLLLHVLEFTNNKVKSALQKSSTGLSPLWNQQISFREWDKENNFNASQLILRNIKNKPVKIRRSLTSGIYEIKNNKLVLNKKTHSAEKKMKKNEFLVQCFAKGRIVSPNIEYANIQVGYGIMKSNKQFKDCFSEIVCLVMKNISLSF